MTSLDEEYKMSYFLARVSFRSLGVVMLISLLTLGIPMGIGWWSGISSEAILALITSTLIFQAAAAVVGVGLGLPPLLVMVLMTSVAIASMVAIFEISRVVENRSEKMNNWISHIRERTKKLIFLQKYGTLMLVPTIWVPGIGLYGTPVVARLFGWDRSIFAAILCMVIGWVVAMVFVMATTQEIFQIFT